MSQPLSTRACGLVVGGRSPGSRAYPSRLPDRRMADQWLALTRLLRGHPRSQWRVRAGFSPASLDHRPLWTRESYSTARRSAIPRRGSATPPVRGSVLSRSAAPAPALEAPRAEPPLGAPGAAPPPAAPQVPPRPAAAVLRALAGPAAHRATPALATSHRSLPMSARAAPPASTARTSRSPAGSDNTATSPRRRGTTDARRNHAHPWAPHPQAHRAIFHAPTSSVDTAQFSCSSSYYPHRRLRLLLRPRNFSSR